MQMTEIQSLLAGDASPPPCISALQGYQSCQRGLGVLLADPLRIAAFALSAMVSA